MAIRKTIIEEDSTPDDTRVVRTTKKVVNPDIHTEVIEDRSTTDSSQPATVKETRVIHEPLVKTEHPQEIFEIKKLIYRYHQIIWYILGVLEVLLGFRIALRAIGANPFSGFVSLIYNLSNPLAVPFSGVVKSSADVQSGAVVEWSTIIAMAVYFIIAWGLMSLIRMVSPVTPEEVDNAV